MLAEKPEFEEDSEAIKTLAYQKWMDQISEDYKIEINPNEIIGNFVKILFFSIFWYRLH